MPNLALYQGQADQDVQDAIANAIGAGVVPPDYTTIPYFLFHKMLGQNVMTAPVLIGMENPTQDLSFPRSDQVAATQSDIGPPSEPEVPPPPIEDELPPPPDE